MACSSRLSFIGPSAQTKKTDMEDGDPPYSMLPLGRAALDFHVRQRDQPYKVVLLGPLTQPGSPPRVSRRARLRVKVAPFLPGSQHHDRDARALCRDPFP